MEVIFDKALVSGNLSTPAGAIDLTERMDPQEEDSHEVQQQEDPGESSEALRQTKKKGKRVRTSCTNLDGSLFYTAYKSTLDKWTTSTCETSATTVLATIPSIAECMAMIRELGVLESSPTFVRACKVLKDLENHEIFSNLKTAEGKQAFLDDCGLQLREIICLVYPHKLCMCLNL